MATSSRAPDSVDDSSAGVSSTFGKDSTTRAGTGAGTTIATTGEESVSITIEPPHLSLASLEGSLTGCPTAIPRQRVRNIMQNKDKDIGAPGRDSEPSSSMISAEMKPVGG